MEQVIPEIPGLLYGENYISEEEHQTLLNLVDSMPWSNVSASSVKLSRRVQHYGYRYDYRAREVSADDNLGPMPSWLEFWSDRLYIDEHMSTIPDQVIVNEYMPGQGISRHIDCEPCFGDTVASISLGSSCVMDFLWKFNKKRKLSLWLEPRSLLVLKGVARYDWLHAIFPRKTDRKGNLRFPRRRRVSMTFRRVTLQDYGPTTTAAAEEQSNG